MSQNKAIVNKVVYLMKRLDDLYPNPKPFLNFHNPYTCLVAVLLSAQCTDKMVNKVTTVLFQKAVTPEAMLKLGLDEIISIVKPCGFYLKKAKGIYDLSKILIDKHNSIVPSTIDELIVLPMVGRKTASVVVSHCFNVPSFPVDTHIKRLAIRYKLSSHKDASKVSDDLMKIFPVHSWNKLHLQLISYARQYCKANTCNKVNNLCEFCLKFS